MDMSAEQDGIMRAVYLPEVTEDYEATVTVGEASLPHKYGCSGIDGLGWGPAWGSPADGAKGGEQLRICYGIYGDNNRTDNDDQVILSFDAATWWDEIAQPLRQSEMHHCGARSLSKCLVRTGNTTWGVQNLEYDAYSHRWMLAVYRGKKAAFPNYDMFFIAGDAQPTPGVHAVYGEPILTLPMCSEGIYFPYGSTGMYAFGDGRYYFSQHGSHAELGQFTNATLYRAGADGEAPFLPVAVDKSETIL